MSKIIIKNLTKELNKIRSKNSFYTYQELVNLNLPYGCNIITALIKKGCIIRVGDSYTFCNNPIYYKKVEEIVNSLRAYFRNRKPRKEIKKEPEVDDTEQEQFCINYLKEHGYLIFKKI